MRLRLDPIADRDGGKLDVRCSGPETLGTGGGGTLSELRRIPFRDTSVFERESVSTRKSALGFDFGLARVGVDDPDAETNDGVTDATEAERLCADVEGDAPDDNWGRCFIEPLRAPRPATVAPSLIQPPSLSFSRTLRFLSFCGVGEGEGGGERSCDTRRPKNRRLGDSVTSSSSLSLSAPRLTARTFAAVRVLHFSVPPLPVFPLPRNNPAILLKNPPLPLRSRIGAGNGPCRKDRCVADWEGGVDVC